MKTSASTPVFERYTERARRALFFARYEVADIGGDVIEPEHLLLGLIREAKGPSSRIFARAEISLDAVRSEVQSGVPPREKLSTSVEIPFSAVTKRILCVAADEAERLGHNYIGTEHLLLGILCETDSLAARLLTEKGIQLDAVRDEIVRVTDAHE